MQGTNKKLRNWHIICLVNEKKKKPCSEQTSLRDTELSLLKMTIQPQSEPTHDEKLSKLSGPLKAAAAAAFLV